MNIRFLGPSRLYNILLPPTNLFTLLRRRRAGGATELVKIRPLGTPPLLITQTQQLKTSHHASLTDSVMRFTLLLPGSVTNSIGYDRSNMKFWMDIPLSYTHYRRKQNLFFG